jgi:hypothetical protein
MACALFLKAGREQVIQELEVIFNLRNWEERLLLCLFVNILIILK